MKKVVLSAAQEAHIDEAMRLSAAQDDLAVLALSKGFTATAEAHSKRARNLLTRAREIRAGVNFGVKL